MSCRSLFLVSWIVYKEFMISTFSTLELISLMMNTLFEICRVTYNVYGLQQSGPMSIVSTINRSNSQFQRPGRKCLVIDVPL